MKLQKIIVVRHGSYGSEGNLTEEGREQVRKLARELATRLDGCSIVILSSPAQRAKETSEILASRLGVLSFEQHPCLRSEGDFLTDRQANETLELVAQKGGMHDVIILSTHFEFISEFPSVWGRTKKFTIHKGRLPPKGTARIVDVNTGDVQDVRP